MTARKPKRWKPARDPGRFLTLRGLLEYCEGLNEAALRRLGSTAAAAVARPAGGARELHGIVFVRRIGDSSTRALKRPMDGTRKAADAGSPLGLSKLAFYYDQGFHVEEDPEEALRLYMTAARPERRRPCTTSRPSSKRAGALRPTSTLPSDGTNGPARPERRPSITTSASSTTKAWPSRRTMPKPSTTTGLRLRRLSGRHAQSGLDVQARGRHRARLRRGLVLVHRSAGSGKGRLVAALRGNLGA